MPEFRLPVAGPFNTRVNRANALSSASGVVGAGVVGVMVVGGSSSSTTKDRKFVNCWTETVVDQVQNSKTVYLVKRPGFAALNTPQSGSIGNAIMVWTGQGSGTKVISAFGATNSSIYDGTTRLTTNNGDTTVITGKANGITETSISGTATLFITSSDSTAWFYQPSGTVTKISDADYPGNAAKTVVGTAVHMDGYVFVMDSTGEIWNSDLNSVTSWSASSSIKANSWPDLGRGLIRRGDKIVAFGSESIQFFFNAGNATGSPLQRIESMTIRVGCVNADAITKIENDIYWAGSSPEGGLGIYRLSDGLSKISTAEIDRIIMLAGASNVSMTSLKIYGRSFVVVNASTVTYVYCVEEGLWHQWSSSEPLWYKCAGLSSGNEFLTYSISNVSTSGKVFVINPSSYTYQDNGVSYTSTAQSGLMGSGRNLVSYYDIELIADIEQSSSVVNVMVSDDDFNNTTNLGSIDLSQRRQRIPLAGSAYRRSWILSHESNQPFRIEAIAGRTIESVI